MRYQLLKLTRGHSTKSERIFAEILKELKLKFKVKQKVRGKEIDFIVGNLAIEINGHDQTISKNSELLELGFIPLNFTNSEIKNNKEGIKNILTKQNNVKTKKY